MVKTKQTPRKVTGAVDFGAATSSEVEQGNTGADGGSDAGKAPKRGTTGQHVCPEPGCGLRFAKPFGRNRHAIRKHGRRGDGTPATQAI